MLTLFVSWVGVIVTVEINYCSQLYFG